MAWLAGAGGARSRDSPAQTARKQWWVRAYPCRRPLAGRVGCLQCAGSPRAPAACPQCRRGQRTRERCRCFRPCVRQRRLPGRVAVAWARGQAPARGGVLCGWAGVRPPRAWDSSARSVRSPWGVATRMQTSPERALQVGPRVAPCTAGTGSQEGQRVGCEGKPRHEATPTRATRGKPPMRPPSPALYLPYCKGLRACRSSVWGVVWR
mmetsp:Transcript_16854/g.43036  ORF Transcript_16854/g.43036 Transcript_16854/m.43036 type:complete len:208 (-) Transcript_16854:337-960(-)